jgi:N-methylhydantoinase B/oxoprolinase/acetone carboxylase alpha subunit
MGANILSNRRRIAPFGLEGGESAALGRNWLERGDGTTEILESTATVDMEIGDVFVIETPGGGGWGKYLPVSIKVVVDVEQGNLAV